MISPLRLLDASSPDERLPKKLLIKFQQDCKIDIYTDVYVEAGDNTHVFCLRLDYGRDSECLYFDVKLDELEMFAHSLVKRIEMVRRDYHDAIQEKITNREPV